MVEAGHAFGAHPWQILSRVQIPLAMPTIMAGVNQVIMLAPSMVVIAGMVGSGGLGAVVYEGVSRSVVHTSEIPLLMRTPYAVPSLKRENVASLFIKNNQ